MPNQAKNEHRATLTLFVGCGLNRVCFGPHGSALFCAGWVARLRRLFGESEATLQGYLPASS